MQLSNRKSITFPWRRNWAKYLYFSKLSGKADSCSGMGHSPGPTDTDQYHKRNKIRQKKCRWQKQAWMNTKHAHFHLPNAQVMWHLTVPEAGSYEGGGFCNGAENEQNWGMMTGSHFSSTAVTSVHKDNSTTSEQNPFSQAEPFSQASLIILTEATNSSRIPRVSSAKVLTLAEDTNNNLACRVFQNLQSPETPPEEGRGSSELMWSEYTLGPRITRSGSGKVKSKVTSLSLSLWWKPRANR